MLVGLFATIVYRCAALGLVMATAVLLNLMVAAVVGVVVPLDAVESGPRSRAGRQRRARPSSLTGWDFFCFSGSPSCFCCRRRPSTLQCELRARRMTTVIEYHRGWSAPDACAAMMETAGPVAELVGVLDMGASAIRLVVAEIDRGSRSRSDRRGVARRAARPRHVFRRRDPLADRRCGARGARGLPPDHGGVRRRRCPGRRDQRGPRGAQRRHVPRPDPRPHGHRVRNHQRGGREPARLSWRCASARRHAGVQGRADAARRSRRRQHQPDAAPPGPAEALRRVRARRRPAAAATRPAAARPRRAGGAAQALHRERHRGDPARDPARPHHAHDRDRRRRPVRRVADSRREPTARRREISRDAFLAFCDEVERLDEEGLVDRFRLPAVEAETLVAGAARLPRRCWPKRPRAGRGRVGRLAPSAACCSTSPSRRGASSAEDFERQVLASAEALGPAIPVRP